jgi:hypothetical protein
LSLFRSPITLSGFSWEPPSPFRKICLVGNLRAAHTSPPQVQDATPSIFKKTGQVGSQPVHPGQEIFRNFL